MTQTEFRASHIGGRLFKSAATSALALSALAGGVILSGGHALASGNMDPGPATLNFTDPAFPGVNFHDQATLDIPVIPPTGTSVRYDFELTGVKYPLSQKQIDTDFNGPLTGPGMFTSKYTVTALEPNTYFDQVDLTWVQVPGGNATVSAAYVWDGGGVTLTNSGDIYQIVGQKPTSITVTNTYTPNNGAIDNVENTFRNVPGPLPILGAGAAFGFSRKLRSRIKASRTA